MRHSKCPNEIIIFCPFELFICVHIVDDWLKIWVDKIEQRKIPRKMGNNEFEFGRQLSRLAANVVLGIVCRLLHSYVICPLYGLNKAASFRAGIANFSICSHFHRNPLMLTAINANIVSPLNRNKNRMHCAMRCDWFLWSVWTQCAQICSKW